MNMRDQSYGDILSLEDTFKEFSEYRLNRIFTYPESVDLSRLILGKSFIGRNSREQAIEALMEYYRDPVRQAPASPTCICPEPEGLRWHRNFAAGEKIHWSHDSSKQPFPNAAARLRRLFAIVETLCGARFQEVADRDTDIHFSYAHMDGRGGTLGATIVPATGERLEACGPLCGDVFFDLDELWVAGLYFDVVAAHEISHALGLKHSLNRSDLLFAQLLRLVLWQPGDIAELLVRYPFWGNSRHVNV